MENPLLLLLQLANCQKLIQLNRKQEQGVVVVLGGVGEQILAPHVGQRLRHEVKGGNRLLKQYFYFRLLVK